MIEKEPQFIKPEEVSEKSPEAKEPSPEEKAEMIKGYIEEAEGAGLLLSSTKKGREEVREFFSGLSPDELEATLGKKESDLVYSVISERNNLLGHFAENNLTREGVQQFIEENGEMMVPHRVLEGLLKLDSGSLDIGLLLNQQCRTSKGESAGFSKEFKESILTSLESAQATLRAENVEWEKHQKFERGKGSPPEIQGFERFNFPSVEGKELVEMALKVLPREVVSTNIGKVEYHEGTVKADEKYGFSGTAAGDFVPQEGGRHLVRIFRKPSFISFGSKEEIDYLSKVPYVIWHEGGHSLDPRIVDQPDLTIAEQFQMIEEWERVRASEEEFSNYVKKINNPNKKVEIGLKSQESLADSAAHFFNDPFVFEQLHPRRWQFFTNLIKQRFPEFNLRESVVARQDYDLLMHSLGGRDEEPAEKIKRLKKFLQK